MGLMTVYGKVHNRTDSVTVDIFPVSVHLAYRKKVKDRMKIKEE